MATKHDYEIEKLEEEINKKVKKFKEMKETSEKYNKDLKFRNEVNKNAENFYKIKKELDNCEDVVKLTESIKDLEHILYVCRKYDYNDTPYGAFSIGPDDAHENNSTIKKECKAYKKEIYNKVIRILTIYYDSNVYEILTNY